MDLRRLTQIERQTKIISRLVRYQEFVLYQGHKEAFEKWLEETHHE